MPMSYTFDDLLRGIRAKFLCRRLASLHRGDLVFVSGDNNHLCLNAVECWRATVRGCFACQSVPFRVLPGQHLASKRDLAPSRLVGLGGESVPDDRVGDSSHALLTDCSGTSFQCLLTRLRRWADWPE